MAVKGGVCKKKSFPPPKNITPPPVVPDLTQAEKVNVFGLYLTNGCSSGLLVPLEKRILSSAPSKFIYLKSLDIDGVAPEGGTSSFCKVPAKL